MWPLRKSETPSPSARFRVGTGLLNRGRAQDAIPILRELCDEQPDNGLAALNLGIAYHRTGKHTPAIEQFQRAAELFPGDARPLLNLAAAENALGHVDKAEQYLLRALDVDPRQPGVHYNLAVIYLKRNQLANAMAEMELELSVNPRHAETQAAIRALRQKLLPR
jgi:Flp pilus assembly protein TadD